MEVMTRERERDPYWHLITVTEQLGGDVDKIMYRRDQEKENVVNNRSLYIEGG
jgi:hypothetical protein